MGQRRSSASPTPGIQGNWVNGVSDSLWSAIWSRGFENTDGGVSGFKPCRKPPSPDCQEFYEKTQVVIGEVIDGSELATMMNEHAVDLAK